MASGTISFADNGAMRGQIVWSSAADINTNTSTITVALQVRKGSAYTATTGTFYGSLTVGSSSTSGSYYGAVASDWVTVVSCSKTISHDSNGNGSCYLYGEITGPSGTTLAGVSVSGGETVTLDTIPRASTFTCSGGSLGSPVTFSITRKSTSFTHIITYQCGTASGTAVSQTSAESVSWTPPLTLAKQNTKGATVPVTFKLTTYSGSTVVSSASLTVSLMIPDSVSPTVSVAVEDATTCYADYGAYVQSKSALKITLTAAGVYGSTIASQQVKFDGSTYLGTSNTTDVIKGSGTLQLVATVKDSRGKTASVTVDISVLAYAPPQISALSVTRCNADGEKNAAGAYLIAEFDASVTPLNNKNSASYSIQYKKRTESVYTSVPLDELTGEYAVQGYAVIFEASKSTSYDVVLTVEDDFGPIPKNAAGASEVTLWSKMKNGVGFAIGKVAERAGYLDMGWHIHMNDHRIHGLPEPVDDDDAATKGYVGTVANDLWNTIYPVGAIYISVADASPASLFGGTWEQIKDVFLLAAGDTYAAGTTGGEAAHTLTINEMPSHRHYGVRRNEVGEAGAHSTGASSGSADTLPYTDYSGGDQAHNNMPPYLTVYVWQRVE